MSNPLNFAVKLKTLRRAKEISMADMDKRCGFPDGKYEKIESGEHEPLAGSFLRVLVALHSSANAFDPEDFERVSQI